MHQAMIAPKGPVAFPKTRGSENMPDPTMDPTTIAVRMGSVSFLAAADAGASAVASMEGDAIPTPALQANARSLPGKVQCANKFVVSPALHPVSDVTAVFAEITE